VGVKDRGPHPYTTEGLPLSLSLSVLHLLWVASSFPSGMERERVSVEGVPVKRERRKC